MKREEAIEVLRRLPIGLMDLSCEQKSDLTEALNIALAALRGPTREQVEVMERYSDRAIEIINELHRERLDYQSEYLPLIDAANKLLAYEDTGLEPEQVMQTIDPERLRLKAHWIYDGKTDEDGNLVCRCSRCEHGDRHSPGITVPYCWFCGAKMEDKSDD